MGANNPELSVGNVPVREVEGLQESDLFLWLWKLARKTLVLLPCKRSTVLIKELFANFLPNT